MPRVLLIPLGSASLPEWSLRGFEVDRAPTEADGLRSIGERSCDAIVVVARGRGAGMAALCDGIDAACGADVVPLVLAADGHDHRAVEALDNLSFDAFLDLGWDLPLVERCLSLSIARVHAGRGVAAIQHQVLGAVGGEVAALKDLSLRDGLTGLYNARHFREVLSRENERCRRHGRLFAIACFDLDNLREINNTLGHEAGSRALMRVASSLASTTRQSDYAFRIGGDEFVSLLCECDREAAGRYAQRLCAAVRQGSVGEGEACRVSVSAGVAVFPEDGITAEAVLRSADSALYRAKASGRDRVVVYDPIPLLRSTS